MAPPIVPLVVAANHAQPYDSSIRLTVIVPFSISVSMRILSSSCSLLLRTAITPLIAALVTPLTAWAQRIDSARVATEQPAKWHVQATAVYSEADNGFGVWRGQDVRVLYSGKRFSPFVNIGTQSRPNGSQNAFGVGSYISITPSVFSIVGIGFAPDHGTVLFPKVRADAALFSAIHGVPGLLMSAGVTELRFTDPRSGGRIFSVGPTLYHGQGIYSAAIRLNSDRASGARSASWQAGGQWGRQGSYWFGGGVGSGNEAYQVLSATPFDARFRSEWANAFVSKWITKDMGVSLRLDYEHKINVYRRKALSLSYFVDF